MNYFQWQLEKSARRIKKLKENPDPNRLQATALLYELEIELRTREIDVWRTGKPFCYGPTFPALINAMGFQYLPIQNEADRITDAERYFNVLRGCGYPDFHCDRTIIGVGMVLAGDLPVPAMTVAINQACDPIMLMGHSIGQAMSQHYYCIDIDAKHDEPSERMLRYVTQQIEEWVEFSETKVPGVKLNYDLMAELTEADRQACGYLADIYQLRKKSPCPVAGQDIFRLPRFPSQFPHPWKVVDYFRVLRDEIGERAAKGVGSVKEEKVRILWAITAPFFTDVFRILESQGASVVHFQIGGSMRLFGGHGYYLDESEFGRKLTPLEDQARICTLNSWAGLAGRWVDDMIYFCKELKVDGVVHFEQWGCVAAVLTRRVAKDRIEAELGIPNIFIEGRNLDNSTFDMNDFRDRITQFIQMCIDQKASRVVA